MAKEKTRYGLSSPQKQTISSLIFPESANRKNADIGKWRKAIRDAEDVESPDRTTLLDIYADTMLDGLVISVTQRILLNCTNSPIHFTKDGQTDNDHPVSKMIKSPLFLEIIEHIVSSKHWGYSLIELDFEDGKLVGAELIPRKNVIPEWGIVVKNIGDTEGINYLQPPYSNYVLPIGKKRDLGLLNPATQYVILKRAGLSNMAEFVERYGVPIMVHKYDPQVPTSRDEVEKNAKEQGAAAVIVQPIGTDSAIHKGADGAGSAVFKDNKAMNDEELLLIFLLQTMTSKDGSSKSQAEVHKQGENELISAYKMFVELVLNYKLKPLLAMHGMDVEGGEFKYDDTERLSKTELVKILVELNKLGEVPIDYIEKHLGIKLTRKEQSSINQEEEQEQEPTEQEEEEAEDEKKKTDLVWTRYKQSCSCAHEPAVMTTLSLSETEENELLERIYRDRLNGDFDPSYFNQLTAGLVQQLNKEWPTPKDIDYNSPDHLTKTLMELNLFRFSATKDMDLIRKANELLRDSKTFDEFKQAATPLFEAYNVNYLRTEYETAQATGQSTANYLRNLEVADEYPYWEYQTVGDDRVRASHAALNGKLFLAGQAGTLTPPNGWNCRCELIPRFSKDGKQVLSEYDAEDLLGEEVYDKIAESGFAGNRAASAYVFSDRQMYLSEFSEEQLGYKNFGLEPYSKLGSTAPVAKTTKRTKAQAEQWFEGLVGQHDLEDKNTIRLLDYNKRPIELSRSTLTKNKNWHALDLMANAISNPDELYFVRNKKGYTLTSIQYYQDKPLVVLVEASIKGAVIKKWSFVSGKSIDKARKGLLIKSK